MHSKERHHLQVRSFTTIKSLAVKSPQAFRRLQENLSTSRRTTLQVSLGYHLLKQLEDSSSESSSAQSPLTQREFAALISCLTLNIWNIAISAARKRQPSSYNLTVMKQLLDKR